MSEVAQARVDASRLPPVGYFGARAGLLNMYVDTADGDDANDGKDWRTAKKYVMSAALAMPTGGTIHIMDGAYAGGPVQGQGIWLAGGVTAHPEWGFADLAPGGPHAPFNLIGYAGPQAFVQQAFVGARIFPGKPTDVSRPSDRRQVGLWITNNSGSPVCAYGLSFKDEFPIGIRLGCNPDPAANPDTDRGSAYTTATVRIVQCNVERDSDGGRDAGPCLDMGYCLWTHIEDCAFISSTDAARGSDRRACILVKPSDGSTELRVYRCRGAQGGIIYEGGASTWGFEIQGWDIEGPGILPPAFLGRGLGLAGFGILNSIHQNDGSTGSDHCIVVQGDGSMVPTQLIIMASDRDVVGPACIFGAKGQAGGSITNSGNTLAAGGCYGMTDNKVIGDHDGHRMSEPVFSNRFRNLIPQHLNADGETGGVVDQPNGSSNTRLTGRHGAVVPGVLGTWVNADVKDHRGGIDAWQLDSSNGSPTTNFLFQGVNTYADGDTFIFGVWVRFPNELSLSASTWGRVGLTQSGGGGTTRRRNLNANGDILLNDHGKKEWQWYSGWIQKVSNAGGSGTWTANFTITATAANPVIYDGACIVRVNTSAEDDNEISAVQQAMRSYLQIPAGAGATTALYQKLLAQGGLGVGNAAAATVAVGTLVKKVEIFDGSGVSIGFVPVYSTIT